jgi:hypothetical protein
MGREDLDFIAALVMASGSLKDLAAHYRVSYPTIRARLDAVIGRLGDAMAGRRPDPLTELLAQLVERGELAGHHARRIVDLSRARHPAAHGEHP